MQHTSDYFATPNVCVFKCGLIQISLFLLCFVSEISVLCAFGWLMHELVPVGSQWGQNNKIPEQSVLNWHFQFTQEVRVPQLNSIQSKRGIWRSSLVLKSGCALEPPARL